MPPDYLVIEAFLVGRCGMTTEQAGWTSWDEFILRKEGKEQEERQAWEIARWQMFLTMQMHPQIKKGHKPTTPQAWIPFPWEKKRQKPKKAERYEPLTEREVLNLCEIFKIDKDRMRYGQDR